jgi:putative addiction module component (TIGR02574 family)
MMSRAEVDRLTPDEKLDLIRTAWESFVADPDSLPITEEEKRELRNRARAHRLNPASSLSEEEFRGRLEEELTRAK